MSKKLEIKDVEKDVVNLEQKMNEKNDKITYSKLF